MTDAAHDFATLQAFIRGRLSGEERLAFEGRLAREPALVDELEQSLRMREGLRRLHARGYFSKAAPRPARLRVWLPALAAAASAVLVLFLWLSRTTTPAPLLMASLESHAAAGATSLVATHFTFVSMRGSSVPDLDLPTTGLIEFRAAADPNPAAQPYRVELVRRQDGADAQPIAALGGLAVGADGYVHCYADAARLAAGTYLLRVRSGPGNSGTDEVFPFNLRLRATDPVR